MIDGAALHDAVKRLDLGDARPVVWGSGVMAIYGIREAADVDLVVSAEAWAAYDQAGAWSRARKGGVDALVIEVTGPAGSLGVEVYFDVSLPTMPCSYEHVLERAKDVEGVLVGDVEHLRDWKIACGRAKDVDDAWLIERYLRTRST